MPSTKQRDTRQHIVPTAAKLAQHKASLCLRLRLTYNFSIYIHDGISRNNQAILSGLGEHSMRLPLRN